MAKSSLKTHLIFDQAYLKKLLIRGLGVRGFKQVSIYPVKVRLTPTFEHVVLAVKAKMPSGKIYGLYAMGHSSGRKKNLFNILKFLISRVKKTRLQVPEPLLYDAKTKSIIYKELSGPNLYALLEKKKKGLLPIFRELGTNMARMHSLAPSKIFNPYNLKMHELDPSNILQDIKKRNRALYNRINQDRLRLGRAKTKILKNNRPRAMVHGDLHPENIIILNKNYKNPKLGLIDIENAGLADREYDLGSFIEQVEIMATPFYKKSIIRSFQRAFLSSYLKQAKININPDIEKRLAIYKAFFGLKAAIFYFRLGWHNKIQPIIARVEKNLNFLEK